LARLFFLSNLGISDLQDEFELRQAQIWIKQ